MSTLSLGDALKYLVENPGKELIRENDNGCRYRWDSRVGRLEYFHPNYIAWTPSSALSLSAIFTHPPEPDESSSRVDAAAISAANTICHGISGGVADIGAALKDFARAIISECKKCP